MGIRYILIAFVCCCLIACGGSSSTDVGDAIETAVGNDTIRADSTANPFPLLNYPPSWYFAIADSDTVTAIDTPVITYPYLNIHYRTFESVVREYGGPTFYREIVYRDGDATSEHGYGDAALLDSILKSVPQARVMLFHWENTTDRDSLQCGYDMDLYFLGDGDSMRVIYGMKFLPGTVAAPY